MTAPMSIPPAPPRTVRERVSEAMLRTGTELAIAQRDLAERMAAARPSAFGSAHGAVQLARWADDVILWLAWRIHPRTFSAGT
jgi:hypothetical protein